jgi:hypothetical protein
MDLIDRFTFLLVGCVLGFLIGYVVGQRRTIEHIKETVDEVDDIVKENLGEPKQKRRRDERGFMRNPVRANLALLVVVLIAVSAAFLAQKAQNDLQDRVQQDERSRCEGAVDSRNAQRDIVDAVYNLAVGFVQREQVNPPRSPAELAEVNRYIDQVNDFRADTYAKIKPSKACEKYVDDINVKPRTPAQPRLLK